MRCDLHVHSWNSGRAAVPVLEHVGRECYSHPASQYRAFERAYGWPARPLTVEGVEGAPGEAA